MSQVMFQSKNCVSQVHEFLYFLSSPVHLEFLPFDAKNILTGLFICLPV